MPNLAMGGTFEVTYVSEPKDAKKPVYVQVITLKEKYRTPLTMAFEQSACPVTEVGQVFKMEADADYQVFGKPKGEKDSHTFVIKKIRSVARFKQELVEIK